MTGFISRVITRHTYPQNNIVPRLPGKFENTAGVTQNLFETDFGTSDIGSTDNPEDVGNNGFIHHTPPNAHKSIVPANENDGEVLRDKSKKGAVKLSNANFQTSFIAYPAAETNKHELSVMPNENITAHQTKIFKPSFADNEHNNNAIVNHTPTLNEIHAADNIDISPSSSRFVASAVSEKGEKINESTSLQIQQPLFTTPPTFRPDVAVPLVSGKDNQQPVIKVHIGRIEIKAINQPTTNEVRTKSNNVGKPAMTLDDYLKKRNAR